MRGALITGGAGRIGSNLADRRSRLGDALLILLECAELRGLGPRPTVTIEDAIRRTVDWLETQA